MEKEFSALSLEYKLSNINQVKSFSRYLNAIHCFYTDRQVDFDRLALAARSAWRLLSDA